MLAGNPLVGAIHRISKSACAGICVANCSVNLTLPAKRVMQKLLTNSKTIALFMFVQGNTCVGSSMCHVPVGVALVATLSLKQELSPATIYLIVLPYLIFLYASLAA